jgi:hypothetical protein
MSAKALLASGSPEFSRATGSFIIPPRDLLLALTSPRNPSRLSRLFPLFSLGAGHSSLKPKGKENILGQSIAFQLLSFPRWCHFSVLTSPILQPRSFEVEVNNILEVTVSWRLCAAQPSSLSSINNFTNTPPHSAPSPRNDVCE